MWCISHRKDFPNEGPVQHFLSVHSLLLSPFRAQAAAQRIHSFQVCWVCTYPAAGPMLGPGYIVSVWSSWGHSLVGSPVSEDGCQEQLTWDLSFSTFSATSANLVLSVRLLCRRGCKDSRLLPGMHTDPQPPGN